MLLRNRLNVREKESGEQPEDMAIAPTATDMPQKDLYGNKNLELAKAKRSGRLTTGEYQICCAVMASFKQSIGSQTIDARVNLSYLVIRRISRSTDERSESFTT